MIFRLIDLAHLHIGVHEQEAVQSLNGLSAALWLHLYKAKAHGITRTAVMGDLHTTHRSEWKEKISQLQRCRHFAQVANKNLHKINL